MATLYLRANVCSVPVMKPCGKKNTGSAKLKGWPSCNQVRKKMQRLIKSFTHDPKLFRLANDTLIHSLGKELFMNAVYISSSSGLITMKPWIAFFTSLKVAVIATSKRLNLIISCVSTIAKLLSNPLGCSTNVDSPASSSSSLSGIWLSNKSASSVTTSSGLLPPPPPPARGCSAKMLPMRVMLCVLLKLVLAFSCMPKISGLSTVGKVSR
mmetsp:Transcript_74775/g.141653  ORF Transcript_74775/g.141653 Transcript_74775/m.141653 type:complete len:211 (-) Transcript_74775:479-1111(-)